LNLRQETQQHAGGLSAKKGNAMKCKVNDLQTALVKALDDAGFTARWWGRNGTAERLYFDYRRDVKAWIEFDDAAALGGPCLKVWVADCGQHANWYVSQRQKVAQYLAPAYALVLAAVDPEDAEKFRAECGANPDTVGDMVQGE